MKLQDVYEQLRAPFPAGELKFKPQVMSKDGNKALAFPHIDARAVQDRLDQAVGPGNWSDSYQVVPGSHVAVICRLTVLGATKEGIGEALPESGAHSAELYKAAESDALKRAAVKFGIARYLYAMPKQWLGYDSQKKKFTEGYPNLEAISEQANHQAAAVAEQQAKPYAPADNRPSAEQQAKMHDFWRRLLQLSKSEAELMRDLEDNYGVSSLDELTRTQAFQWFNHTRAVLNSLYLSQQRLPLEQDAATATVPRSRRSARTETKAG